MNMIRLVFFGLFFFFFTTETKADILHNKQATQDITSKYMHSISTAGKAGS